MYYVCNVHIIWSKVAGLWESTLENSTAPTFDRTTLNHVIPDHMTFDYVIRTLASQNLYYTLQSYSIAFGFIGEA